MRLLVCGGAGFIGSDFVRRLLGKHDDLEVVCFDKLTYAGNLDNLLPVAEDPRYSFVHGESATATRSRPLPLAWTPS
jgi:dTDP-glucose 4,6-dehydratase